MKTNPVLVTVCFALVFCSLIFFIRREDSREIIDGIINKIISDESKDNRSLKDELVSNLWIGNWIEMPGLATPARDVFGSDLRLIFNKNGSCTLEIGGEIIKARWRLKDDKLFLKATNINTDGYIHLDFDSEDLDYFTLFDIENYSVDFFSEESITNSREK